MSTAKWWYIDIRSGQLLQLICLMMMIFISTFQFAVLLHNHKRAVKRLSEMLFAKQDKNKWKNILQVCIWMQLCDDFLCAVQLRHIYFSRVQVYCCQSDRVTLQKINWASFSVCSKTPINSTFTFSYFLSLRHTNNVVVFFILRM